MRNIERALWYIELELGRTSIWGVLRSIASCLLLHWLVCLRCRRVGR